MRDTYRRDAAIKQGLVQFFQPQPTGHRGRHFNTLGAMICGLTGDHAPGSLAWAAPGAPPAGAATMAAGLCCWLCAVYLPSALARKYPAASTEWGWQYVFPAQRRSRDPRTDNLRRHHMDESGLQKAVRAAAQLAGMTRPVGCHTFRHSFATRLIELGYDIRTVQQLLGHTDLKTAT